MRWTIFKTQSARLYSRLFSKMYRWSIDCERPCLYNFIHKSRSITVPITHSSNKKISKYRLLKTRIISIHIINAIFTILRPPIRYIKLSNVPPGDHPSRKPQRSRQSKNISRDVSSRADKKLLPRYEEKRGITTIEFVAALLGERGSLNGTITRDFLKTPPSVFPVTQVDFRRR